MLATRWVRWGGITFLLKNSYLSQFRGISSAQVDQPVLTTSGYDTGVANRPV